MADALADLKEHVTTIKALNETAGLLGWDQRTYMPPRGIKARARQLGTVVRIAHEMLTSDQTGNLLNTLADAGLDPDSDDGRLVDVVRYDYEHALKLSSDYVARRSQVRMLANEAWQQARANNTWSVFEPHMQTIVELTQEQADMLGYTDHIYDPLLDTFERGITTAEIQGLFADLKQHSLPLVKAIAEQQEPQRNACLYGTFPEAEQEAFGREVITRYGYDWSRGRQDRTIHPFCINFGRNDVRITTRFDPDYLPMALFGTLHESGHAMYEQGINPAYEGTPLERGASLGIHESQSRLWENLVGRSRPFWSFFYPVLQQHFPEQFNHVDPDTFYRAVNTVRPSLIRIQADEITYNFHIMLRFELEVALLENKLAVRDLPQAWNAAMEEYFGLRPSNDVEGVLQDIHWSNATLGYFPTYTLGNVLSVQFFNAALAAHPTIYDDMEQGNFEQLHGWLRDNIYQHGRKYTPKELVQRITGGSLNATPYITYLKDKFTELYPAGGAA